MVVFTIPMFFFPDTLAQWFLNPDAMTIVNEELRSNTAIAMRWLWVYFLFDAIAWIISGTLTAAGDTKFVMIMNSVNAWAFYIIPTYFWVSYFEGSPIVGWVLCAFYGLMNMVSFFFRYRNKRWHEEQPLHVLT